MTTGASTLPHTTTTSARPAEPRYVVVIATRPPDTSPHPAGPIVATVADPAALAAAWLTHHGHRHNPQPAVVRAIDPNGTWRHLNAREDAEFETFVELLNAGGGPCGGCGSRPA